MMRLIDTHTHLEEIEDLEGAIQRAEGAGIFAVVAVGMGYESCERVLELSGRYGGIDIYPALGIHPWNLAENRLDSTIRFIEENINQAVAIGEIGLDFWLKDVRKDPSRKEFQRQAFKMLLDLSKRFGKPSIIHARGAWEEALEMTLDARVERANFHCYSGPMELLNRVLENGYLISATPAAAYSRQHRAAIENTPIENLLLETDSPVTYQYEKAEPAHLLKSLEAVAEIKGMANEEVARLTTENALKFFNI